MYNGMESQLKHVLNKLKSCVPQQVESVWTIACDIWLIIFIYMTQQVSLGRKQMYLHNVQSVIKITNMLSKRNPTTEYAHIATVNSSCFCRLLILCIFCANFKLKRVLHLRCKFHPHQHPSIFIRCLFSLTTFFIDSFLSGFLSDSIFWNVLTNLCHYLKRGLITARHLKLRRDA